MVGAILAGCSQQPEKELVPYEALLDRLLDGNLMAQLDAPGAYMVTSFDRTGGNDDYNNVLRAGPAGWNVIADFEGPGYVSRFWFTGSKDGTKKLRFYFDGEKTPSIETTMDTFMGKVEPFTLPLAGYEPYCWFSWLPVPFRKQLIIMEEAPVAGEKLYFQIAANKLPPGQTVESFSLPLKEQAIARLEQIKRAWNNRGFSTSAGNAEARVDLAPGQKTTVLDVPGPATIREILFTPDWNGWSSPSAIEKALRELTVRIYWDGSPSPSVEAPLGALCGSLWSRMRYQSLYFGMTNETLGLKFPMPFQASARIEIENAGSALVPLEVSVSTGPAQPGAGYFHAGWRKSTPGETGRYHTIVEATGRGRYVGCILGVRSLDKSWWVLEGDELMWIDGEKSPSWKGTGLEDYFNGGWYYGNAIASPLQGMPYKVHFRNIQYRLHQADPVNFDRSFNMVFERGPDNASRASFESVSFYYLENPQAANSDAGRQSVHPEPDPLAAHTLMFELNDRERLGDERGARDAAARYLEEFSDVPFAADIRQRIEHYEQGQVLPTGKALLGVYANMPVTVFIDGSPVGRFGNPQGMQFVVIDLAPGRHVVAAQAGRQQYPDWVQIGLKFGDNIVGTDRSWKYSFDQVAGWNRLDFDDRGWPEHGAMWVKGPPEEPFIFSQPNPHVGMQSVPWGIRPPVDWPAGAQQVFYRKSFTVD